MTPTPSKHSGGAKRTHHTPSHLATLPLLCVAAALLEGFLYASGPYNVFASEGVVSGTALLRFFSPLVSDYLVLAIALSLLAWPHWTSLCLCTGLVMSWGALHFIQFTAVKVSGEFITVDALHFANQVDYLLDRQLATSFALSTLAGAVAAFVLLRTLQLPHSSAFRRATWIILCGGMLGLLHLADSSEERDELLSRHGIEFSAPALDLIRTAHAAMASEPEAQLSISRAAIEQARLRGIEIAPEHYTPFARERVYQGSLPFAPRAGVSQPNVVILFIESFSAAVLPAYGAEHPGLTPHIDAFAKESMRVDNYLNHTTPTILGLRGQLCSNYPRLQHFDWAQSEHKPKTGKLLCLPEILHQTGYDTVYLSHARGRDVFLKSQFLDMGVRETHFKDTIMADYLPEEAPDRALLQQAGDVQMFKILVNYLKARDSEEPLFLALSTIETHLASDVQVGQAVYGDGSNPILNTYHQLDRGFGPFWEWFQESEYAENTILILTGDHAMLPHDDLRRIAGPAFRNHRFDYMALFIRDPTHELPNEFRANTTSIDFTPSLLQLLGIQEVPNSFLGLSMFSDRAAVRGGFAFAWGRDMTDWNDEGGLFTVSTIQCNKRLEQLEELAAAGKRPAQACLMYDVLSFAHAMEETNRMWARPAATTR